MKLNDFHGKVAATYFTNETNFMQSPGRKVAPPFLNKIVNFLFFPQQHPFSAV